MVKNDNSTEIFLEDIFLGNLECIEVLSRYILENMQEEGWYDEFLLEKIHGENSEYLELKNIDSKIFPRN